MTRLLLAICFSLLLTSTAAAQFGVGIRDDTPALTDSQVAVLALLSVSGGNLVLADGACLEASNGTTYCGNLGDDLIITAGASVSVQVLVPAGESVIDRVNSVAVASMTGTGGEFAQGVESDSYEGTGSTTAAFPRGLSIANDRELILEEDSRIMIGASGDGLQSFSHAGGGSFTMVANLTEDLGNYLSPAYKNCKFSSIHVSSSLYGNTASDQVPILAGASFGASAEASITATGLLMAAGASDAAGTGPLDMPEGGTVPTGKSIATPLVEGIAGEALVLRPQSGQLLAVLDDDGINTSWLINASGTMIANSGTKQINVNNLANSADNAAVLLKHGAIAADGKTLSTESLTLRGVDAPPTDPADGDIVLWIANDAAAVGNDTLYITDQASTDAAVTHDVIDVEAP